MANNTKSKLKTLYVMRILQEETDPECGLTLRQITDRLNDYGIEAERKSLYRDFETLREFGMDIRTYNRNPVQYALARRDFSLSQLMLLVDTVESCKALSQKQSIALVRNLKLLASDNQRSLLDRRIHVPGRIESKSESVFGHIDKIHEAIRRQSKIEFRYYKYNVDGERYATNNDKAYAVTPVSITYADGFYYLTAWVDEHECMREYRIDRMEKMRLSNKPATKNKEIQQYKYSGEEYEQFGRFGGDPVVATLIVNADKVEIIMDRFGSHAEIYRRDDETAKAIVKIRKSEQFFGWIAGLGGNVRIDAPKTLKQEYNEYLKSLIEE